MPQETKRQPIAAEKTANYAARTEAATHRRREDGDYAARTEAATHRRRESGNPSPQGRESSKQKAYQLKEIN